MFYEYELTDEQSNRLKKKKYTYLNEDEDIKDIYKEIYEYSWNNEQEHEFKDYLGKELILTEFLYPKELV